MTVVRGLVHDAEGPIAGAKVIIDVVGADGRPVVAYHADHTQVEPATFYADVDGTWERDLDPTSGAGALIPSGCRWRIRESRFGKDAVGESIVNMPATGGPYDVIDILADPPGTIASAALDVHDTRPDRHPGRNGLWVPYGWGDHWRTARAEADERLAHLGIWSDSLGQGWGSSNYLTKSYFGLTIARLQAEYGDGGSGFHSVVNSPSANSPGGVPYMTEEGTWDAVFSQLLNAKIIAPSGAVSDGSHVLGCPVRGTAIDIYFLQFAGLDFKYRVDSGAWTNHVNAGSGLGTISITGLSAGDHTVEVASNSASAFFITGFRGRNATGIIGYNFGHWGRSIPGDIVTEAYAGAPAGTTCGSMSFGQHAPWDMDLMIVSQGPNDIATGTSEADVMAFHRVAEVYANLSNVKCDVAVVVHHAGSSDSPNTYTGIVRGARMSAEMHGAAVVNHWARGKGSWDWMNTKGGTVAAGQGYWTAGASGLPGTDGLHPGDDGHAFYADPLIELATA